MSRQKRNFFRAVTSSSGKIEENDFPHLKHKRRCRFRGCWIEIGFLCISLHWYTPAGSIIYFETISYIIQTSCEPARQVFPIYFALVVDTSAEI